MSSHFSFDGVNTRSQYWMTTIGMIVIAGILGAIGGALMATVSALSIVGGIMILAIVVGTIWVSIANSIKRCRDCGLSPMWTIGTVVPYIGVIVYIVIGCLPTKTAQ